MIDKSWLEYCHTDKQTEAVLARLEHSAKDAAELLGIHPRKLQERLERVRRNMDAELPGNLPAGMALDRITQHVQVKDGKGNVKNIWYKGKNENPTDPKQIADEIAKALQELPPAPKSKKPKNTNKNKLLAIPVSDAHVGLYAHHSDAGGDFDLHIAERHLVGAVDYLLSQADPAEEILLEFLGDYFHANDQTNETPRSKHRLDADSRRFKVIQCGMRIGVSMIDRCLEHSGTVHVNIVPGNHDPDATQWFIIALTAHYRKEKRVIINQSQQPMLWHRFGKCLIGVTHGDKIKFPDMPKVLATDCPEWSSCEYREVHSGHIHSNNTKEDMLCEVQSFRILAPGDYYAHSNGYRSGCEMVALEYHKDYGQIKRYRAPLKLVKDITD